MATALSVQMKTKMRALKVIILSLMAIGVISNPSFRVAGSRQIACVFNSGDPEVLNLSAFPIQPDIFQMLEPDYSTSVSHYYDLLTQADQGYLNNVALMNAAFGYSIDPIPNFAAGNAFGSTGYIASAPWAAFANVSPMSGFNTGSADPILSKPAIF